MEFCKNCGAMLLPMDKECKSCGEPVNLSEEALEAYSVSEEIVSKEAVIEKGAEINTLPTIKIECPECGHDTAGWWLRQTRSADEAETRFYKCLGCGHTWREYD